MDVKVKICGVTTIGDAIAAAEAGADAIGLMFYEPSPRFVNLAEARLIVQKLPPFIAAVGVFVNASEGQVRQTVADCGLTAAQFHGDESPEFCRRFRVRTLKAFRIKDTASLDALPLYDTSGWLLDSYVPEQRGGTGAAFNWDLARQAKTLGRKIILAGGLTSANVAEAVRKVEPYGVDVSSGVESSPGRKDPAKMRAFIESVRQVTGEADSG